LTFFCNNFKTNRLIHKNLLFLQFKKIRMSIIKSLFKSDKTSKESINQNVNFPWNVISDVSQIKECIEESMQNTVVIFKHSTRCGTSRAVLKAFEKQTEPLERIKFYYLDLIKHRDVSNRLATEFNILHQSPQLIVLKDGKAIAHGSHYDLLGITF